MRVDELRRRLKAATKNERKVNADTNTPSLSIAGKYSSPWHRSIMIFYSRIPENEKVCWFLFARISAEHNHSSRLISPVNDNRTIIVVNRQRRMNKTLAHFWLNKYFDSVRKTMNNQRKAKPRRTSKRRTTTPITSGWRFFDSLLFVSSR